jgi:hypothetical protein
MGLLGRAECGIAPGGNDSDPDPVLGPGSGSVTGQVSTAPVQLDLTLR